MYHYFKKKPVACLQKPLTSNNHSFLRNLYIVYTREKKKSKRVEKKIEVLFWTAVIILMMLYFKNPLHLLVVYYLHWINPLIFLKSFLNFKFKTHCLILDECPITEPQALFSINFSQEEYAPEIQLMLVVRG